MSPLLFKIKSFHELTNTELYDIMHLRQLVFVVEQNAAYLDADLKDLNATHIFSYYQKQLACYARILPPGVSYKEPSIGRVVSLPEYRHKGFGKELMKTCMTVLEVRFPNQGCRISAQCYLIPFYTNYGFNVCSNEYLEDGLPHVEMYIPIS